MFPVNLISNISPIVARALLGPAGQVFGSFLSSKLGGVDMNTQSFVDKLKNDPDTEKKIKEFEAELNDLQQARLFAEKDTGLYRLVRPILAIAAMFAIVFDIIAINYTNNLMLEQVLVVMLVVLVWDVRQIYKFYFGDYNDLPDFFSKKK